MQTITVLSCVFALASAQLAAWPASSYSPYYQALFSAAQNPVLSAPIVTSAGTVGAAPIAAAPAPFVAAAPAPIVAAAPAPYYAAAPAPLVAAAAPLRGPAFAYAPSPVLAQVRPPVVAAAPAFAPAPVVAAAPAFAPAPVFAAPAPVLAAPAPVFAAPRVVPAFSPFARTAFFIGSNKAKTA